MRIEVLSQFLFDEKMETMGLNDNNVEDSNMAFISIIGTKDCLEYYLDEGNTKHYFKEHPNVLNLDFDDISTDVKYDGHIFRTMTMEQAEKAVKFIEKMVNEGKTDLYIHCRAGMSRSRAFAEFAYRTFIDKFDIEYDERNYYLTILNHGVLRRLNHAYWKLNKLNGYSNGEDYEDELANPPLRTLDLYEDE